MAAIILSNICILSGFCFEDTPNYPIPISFMLVGGGGGGGSGDRGGAVS